MVLIDSTAGLSRAKNFHFEVEPVYAVLIDSAGIVALRKAMGVPQPLPVIFAAVYNEPDKSSPDVLIQRLKSSDLLTALAMLNRF